MRLQASASHKLRADDQRLGMTDVIGLLGLPAHEAGLSISSWGFNDLQCRDCRAISQNYASTRRC